MKNSKVQSVIGKYIRGEKKIQDIIHPSKLSCNRPGYNTRRHSLSRTGSSANNSSCAILQCKDVFSNGSLFRASSCSKQQKESSGSCVDSSLSLITGSVDDSSACKVVTTNLKKVDTNSCQTETNLFSLWEDSDKKVLSESAISSVELTPIKIRTVDRLDFDGDNLLIKLNPKEGLRPDEAENSKVDCSIRPSFDDDELGLLIYASNRHILNQVVLENKALKVSVQPIQMKSGGDAKKKFPITSGDMTETELLQDSKKTDTILIDRMGLDENRNVSFFVDVATQVSEDFSCDSSEIFNLHVNLPLADKHFKSLKTDIYYYKDKIAHEQEQIEQLKREIGEAAASLEDYENKRHHSMYNESLYFGKNEFETLLKEFLAASETHASSGNVWDVGLNFLVTDYFTKYYNKLDKKISPFRYQRDAVQTIMKKLTTDKEELQQEVNCLKRKLDRKKIH